jgi:hypothetical protein
MNSSKAVFLEEKRRKMLVFDVHHQEKCASFRRRAKAPTILPLQSGLSKAGQPDS